ncbi:PAS domain-containing protein [Flavobacterium litorale]|uniref:PAS domain-containing protein n=1 Tax=Flavobacterium litorale TaxID=2856519 RepID=A0ABX8V4W5_9FLAO|nr:PAS domain-containing protein [Flavobacterium litorale]QYJ67867.1 PAS domain-containing protein [Flavobacterium litorale]
MDRFSTYFDDSDISKNHDAEHISIIKEEYFSRLIEFIPAIIYTCDVEGRITYYNKAAANFWGANPKIGKDYYYTGWKAFTIEGDPLEIEKTPIAKALKEGKSFNEEIIIENVEGKRFYVECRPKPLFNTSGKLIGLLNSCVDFTKYHMINNKEKEK